jgi:outer membrane protein assembly factor BamB
MRRLFLVSALSIIVSSPALSSRALSSRASAADWPQFRGESGSAVGAGSKIPDHWDNGANLLWKAKLPGPGASSPIILGDHIYVTCYSGYGTNAENSGDHKDLVRHLVCLDRKRGEIKWTSDVRTDSPEANYRGQMTQHGYASNTPATDGQRIYVFLGTAGVYAFDLKGKELWKQKIGTGTDQWGSATSVRLFDNLVIVNAAIECSAVVALKKENGEEAWRFPVARRSWSTPALVQTALDEKGAGEYELVISGEGRISGVDPLSGKELWHCEGIQDYTCPSVIPGKGVAYVSGARQNAIIAVRCGGSGDVNGSHVLWRQQRVGANVPTPVLYDGRLFGIKDRGGVAYCINAASGAVLYEKRLSTDETPVRPAAFQPGLGQRGRGGRRGGMGGGPGGGGGLSFYASAVAADGKVFVVSRTSGVFVLAAKPEFELLARNLFDGDNGPFDGTPAICDNEIFLRSNANLYCIGTK